MHIKIIAVHIENISTYFLSLMLGFVRVPKCLDADNKVECRNNMVVNSYIEEIFNISFQSLCIV